MDIWRKAEDDLERHKDNFLSFCIHRISSIVFAEASNLFDMHINDSSTAWLKDMATDSYGNAHSNVLISYNCSSGHATFVLNKKYKYIKFSIAASDS